MFAHALLHTIKKVYILNATCEILQRLVGSMYEHILKRTESGSDSTPHLCWSNLRRSVCGELYETPPTTGRPYTGNVLQTNL